MNANEQTNMDKKTNPQQQRNNVTQKLIPNKILSQYFNLQANKHEKDRQKRQDEGINYLSKYNSPFPRCESTVLVSNLVS